MKRFFSALALCLSLLSVLTLWLFPSVAAREDPIITLLNLPAPPAPNPWVTTPVGTRPPEFYSKSKPPPDNAPIEDLMDYWSRQSSGFQELGYTPTPSSVVVGRIMREIEGDPSRITEFLNVLQDDRRAADIARDLYRKLAAGSQEEGEGDEKGFLKEWLTKNTSDFSGDLEKGAVKVKDVAEYVSNQDELLTLAKVDWDKAAPIVNKLYGDKGQKVSQVLATWALYKNAMRSGGSDVDRYRDELKAVVENKEATDAMRDLALDALLKEKDWSGRDDWYMSLLADETLDNLQVNGSTYTGLTTIMYYDEDDRLTEKMIAMMGSDNITVRTAAAKNLMLRLNRIGDVSDDTLPTRKAIIESMLPWFENRTWIKADPAQRDVILRGLSTVKMPEAVPALIAALDEKQGVNDYRRFSNANAAYTVSNMVHAANYATNAANYSSSNSLAEVDDDDDELPDAPVSTSNSVRNANMVIANAMRSAEAAIASASNAANTAVASMNAEYYPLRSSAISALAFQQDGRAVPALRRILPVVQEYERGGVIKALLHCNGFTTDERVAALEYVARSVGESPDSESTYAGNYASPTWRARVALGSAFVEQSTRVAPLEIPEEDTDKEFDSYTAPTEKESDPFNLTTPEGPVTAYEPGELHEDGLKTMVAAQLVQMKDVDEDLIKGMIVRIGQLDKREPVTAGLMRKVMLGWDGAALNAMLLNDIKNGLIDPDVVVKLLSIRRELREKHSPDVTNLRTGQPFAIGFAACLLEEKADYDPILTNGADASKIALLACGRLIRAQLPVARAIPLLRSPNKVLATAAERFLESEDSPESRAAVLALYPNQAKILGATTSFDVPGLTVIPGTFLRDVFRTVNPYFGAEEYAYQTFGQLDDFTPVEKRLQKEVIANPELLGVYAYDQHFIRIYKDKAVFSWEDDPARYRERTLEPEQFESLKGYLASSNVDKMPPFLACSNECESKELLMLGRNGGRRVYLKTGDKLPEFFAGIKYFFDEMKRQPAKLKYYAGEQVPGLEVLYADDKLSAISVWKRGVDLRVLVWDEARERAITAEVDEASETALKEIEDDTKRSDHYNKYYKLRESRKFESVGWLNIADGQLGSAVTQPREAEYLPVNDGLAPAGVQGQWKGRAGEVEVRADDGGLYKITAGRSVRIRTGSYSDPVVTTNGRWAVVTKFTDNEGPTPVRVNLATNREYKIASELPVHKAIAFIESRNLVLARGYDEEDHHGEESEGNYHESAYDNGLGYYLINPDTGVVYPGSGELRPIAQQSFRPLQPTGAPGEFWAAIPRGEAGTLVGTYSARTGKFTQLMKLPKIIFDSTEMWVDEGKVFFVHEGHLLSAPIAARPAETPTR